MVGVLLGRFVKGLARLEEGMAPTEDVVIRADQTDGELSSAGATTPSLSRGDVDQPETRPAESCHMRKWAVL